MFHALAPCLSALALHLPLGWMARQIFDCIKRCAQGLIHFCECSTLWHPASLPLPYTPPPRPDGTSDSRMYYAVCTGPDPLLRMFHTVAPCLSALALHLPLGRMALPSKAYHTHADAPLFVSL